MTSVPFQPAPENTPVIASARFPRTRLAGASASRFFRCCALALVLAASAVAADAPKWLVELAQQPRSAPAGDPPAQVLLDELALTVDETGATVQSRRLAVVVLNKSGAEYAVGRVRYLEKRDVVRRSEAWLLRGAKTVRGSGARDWTDYKTGNGTELVSEGREKFTDLSALAAPGDVFGFETRVDGALLFAGTEQTFGWPVPAVLERFQIQLPAGFTLDRRIEAGPAPQETVSADGRTWTWELRDRPYRRSETWSDPAAPDTPTLRLRLRPPAGANRFKPPVFLSWADAARWELRLHAGQCDSSPALQATAARLTAGLTDPLARIRALGEYVQDVRYIQVNRELARGYGFRPRKSSEVFATGYGDCKDKTNLLCALLREAGVTAHPVGVLASDSLPVNPDWPAVDQFDHAIAAIEVPAEVESPAIVEGPGGRRLLFFDPTDDDTPLGGLPWPLQGSRGQLVVEGADALVQLPRLPESAQFGIRHRAKLSLAADGSVTGTVAVEQTGQAAAAMRRRYRQMSEKELTESVLRQISETLRGATLARTARQDGRREGKYGLEFEFAVPSFAQPLRESLALVRLDVLSRDSVPVFSEKNRRTPVRVRPVDQTDEVELALPAGVTVDELPPAAKLESRFGAHERSFEVRGSSLVFRRRLVLKSAAVPVADYAALRQFLADAAKADRAAVVLKRI